MFVTLHKHMRGPSKDIWSLILRASYSNIYLWTEHMSMHEKYMYDSYFSI